MTLREKIIKRWRPVLQRSLEQENYGGEYYCWLCAYAHELAYSISLYSFDPATHYSDEMMTKCAYCICVDFLRAHKYNNSFKPGLPCYNIFTLFAGIFNSEFTKAEDSPEFTKAVLKIMIKWLEANNEASNGRKRE